MEINKFGINKSGNKLNVEIDKQTYVDINKCGIYKSRSQSISKCGNNQIHLGKKWVWR